MRIREPKDIIINGKALDDILSDHAKWLEETDGKGSQATYFHGADLSGANLIGANLINTDLVGANLSGANLNGAVLIFADLRRANLSKTNLSKADLSEADLSRAAFNGADLGETNLCMADLQKIEDISEAKGLDSTNFTDAKLDAETRQFLAGINKTVKPTQK